MPRAVRQRLYDRLLSRHRTDEDPAAAAIDTSDFELRDDRLAECLDLIAVCRGPG